MVKPLRIILIVIIFIAFFEVGLISSYTIVTSDIPDVKGLIDMQVQKISTIFSPDNIGQVLLKDPTKVSISNKQSVALEIQSLTNVDGIDLESMNVTTYDDPDNDEINVTVTCLGYEQPSTSDSQIILSQDPSYKVIVTVLAEKRSGHFVVDTKTIHVESILKLC